MCVESGNDASLVVLPLPLRRASARKGPLRRRPLRVSMAVWFGAGLWSNEASSSRRPGPAPPRPIPRVSPWGFERCHRGPDSLVWELRAARGFRARWSRHPPSQRHGPFPPAPTSGPGPGPALARRAGGAEGTSAFRSSRRPRTDPPGTEPPDPGRPRSRSTGLAWERMMIQLRAACFGPFPRGIDAGPGGSQPGRTHFPLRAQSRLPRRGPNEKRAPPAEPGRRPELARHSCSCLPSVEGRAYREGQRGLPALTFWPGGRQGIYERAAGRGVRGSSPARARSAHEYTLVPALPVSPRSGRCPSFAWRTGNAASPRLSPPQWDEPASTPV